MPDPKGPDSSDHAVQSDMPKLDPHPEMSEIKDARLIFDTVWSELEERSGREALIFPREIIWLGGAPGAGKGTNTPFIAQNRDITAPPIVMSDLLNSPQAQVLKDAGKMVGDREVVKLLFQELLAPQYRDGCIVDGFPRTVVQVETLKLLHDAMVQLYNEFSHTPRKLKFHKPHFRIALLFVSEEVSIQRQLYRGEQIRLHNQKVRESGKGDLKEERKTDTDTDLCRKRYRTFKDTTFDALQSLRKLFHFYFINAEGSLEDVQRNIEHEFAYQSSLELTKETYDLVHRIPVASRLGEHARQELIERLDRYQEEHRTIFEQVVELLESKFMPIIRAHSISGQARISTESDLLDDPVALNIMLDIFFERGYRALCDVRKESVPVHFDVNTGKITNETKRVYRVHVSFEPSNIRRGH